MFRGPAFADVVNAIYTAALDPSRWPSALSSVHRSLNGSTVTSLAYVERLGDGGLGYTNAEYTDPGWHWQAIQAMEPRCPRFQNAVRHFYPGSVLFDAMHGHDGPLGDSDPCYRWYERELDARFYIAGPLFQSGGRHAYVAVQRSRRTGHVSPAEIRLFRRLLPHLRRAVEINHALGEARLGPFGPQALEQMPQATAALDAQGRVLRCNTAMEAVLRAEDGLVQRQGELHAQRTSDERRLGRLLGQALHGGQAGAMSLARPSGRRAYGLIMVPVPRATPFFMARAPAGLMFVLDPEALPLRPVAAEVLADAFDLTPMQARIAGLLGRAQSLDQCAQALAVSRNTVRTHAREVYRKLGVARQSDLMALLAAWPDVGPSDAAT